MSEDTQQTQTRTEPPATGTTSATDTSAAVALGEAKAKLAAIEAQKAAEQAAQREAEKASAAAKHAAEVEKERKRAEDAAAKAVALQARLRDQMVLSLLPAGLKRPADNPDLFVSMFTRGIELAEDGTLPAEAVETVKARAAEHAYLFDGADSPGSMPMAGSGVVPSGGAWTPEEKDRFAQLGVKPGAYKQDPRYQALRSTFFANFGGPLHG